MLLKEGVVPGDGNFKLVGDLESAVTSLLKIHSVWTDAAVELVSIEIYNYRSKMKRNYKKLSFAGIGQTIVARAFVEDHEHVFNSRYSSHIGRLHHIVRYRR